MRWQRSRKVADAIVATTTSVLEAQKKSYIFVPLLTVDEVEAGQRYLSSSQEHSAVLVIRRQFNVPKDVMGHSRSGMYYQYGLVSLETGDLFLWTSERQTVVAWLNRYKAKRA